ncbi:MAG TPA: hypothetical protein P5064_09435, partial [Clostridia bacterium]|nr:hypothetical protein [Clostridia bacterium]
TYEIPVFDIPKEVFTTLKVEKQDIHDYERINLDAQSLGGSRGIVFSYSDFESATLLVSEQNTVVKEGDVLAVKSDKTLEYDLRLKLEDLELKQLLYEELYRKYLNTGEGYYDMQLALSDMELAQFNYDKALEKLETLQFKAPYSGTVNKVVTTYKNEKDEFNNQYKVYSVTYYITPDNYSVSLQITAAGYPYFEELGYKSGDTLQIYDKDGKIHNMIIKSIFTRTTELAGSKIKTAFVYLEFIKEEGVDYGELIKYALFYDMTLAKYDDVIVVPVSYVRKTSEGKDFTYVLENGRKVPRTLIVGNKVLNGTAYLVLDGLYEDDLIITGSSFE